MRLSNKNYTPGDVVLLDGKEVPTDRITYADDVLGEVEFIDLRSGDKWPDRVEIIGAYIVRGQVEIRLGNRAD